LHKPAPTDPRLMGVAEFKYDKRSFRSLKPLVGVIHELPLPRVSYINSATPISADDWLDLLLPIMNSRYRDRQKQLAEF
jgi:hypothetical protein